MSDRVFVSHATTVRGGRCHSYACASVHVTTAGFPGKVVCAFLVNGDFIDEDGPPFEPDESRDASWWMQTPGGGDTVRCGDVAGTITRS